MKLNYSHVRIRLEQEANRLEFGSLVPIPHLATIAVVSTHHNTYQNTNVL